MRSALSSLEALSDDQLRSWLRAAIWLDVTAPVHVPPTSRPASYLGEILIHSLTLVIRLQDILPGLVQEWSVRAEGATQALDRLLILCGALRVAGAEPEIARIARDRLTGLPEEVDLRARCLAVLAGFGCTDRTTSIFKAFLQDADYAAICYRALYRYDRAYAASKLPEIATALRDARDDLVDILKMLFFVELRPTEARDVVEQLLAEAPRSVLASILELLGDVGVRAEPPLRGVREDFELGFYPPEELDIEPINPQRLRLSKSVMKIVSDVGEASAMMGFGLLFPVGGPKNGAAGAQPDPAELS